MVKLLIHIAVLLSAILAAQAACGQEFDKARFAIIVGHNIGNHTTEDLSFAEKDAQKIAALFESLGNVPRANMFVTIAPDGEELRKTLAAAHQRLKGVGEEARTELFFYYSGHADDSGLQLGEDLFPLKELKQFLKESGADATIALIDACHSGAIIREKGGKRIPIVDLTLSSEGQTSGLAIITSSSAGEKSQESDELRGSFFTHFLVSGMRGDADSSEDGKVTLHELYQYAYNKTRRRTYASGAASQHPTFNYEMTGSGEIVVSYPVMGRSRLVLPDTLEGNYLVYSPDSDTVLAEIEKKKGETTVLAVPPGKLELFRRSDVSLRKTTITVEDGEEKTVPAGEMVEVSRTYLIEKGASPRLTLGAKGGYQFFWDDGLREQALLPSWLGGLEFRVRNWVDPHIVPFAEVLVGGGTASSRGAETVGPLAQSSAYFEFGLGVIFDLFPASPFILELAPEVALFYARLTVENQSWEEPEKMWYLNVSPQASVLIGWQFVKTLSIGLQGKVGYLYFENSGQEYHLGFTEAYLTVLMKL